MLPIERAARIVAPISDHDNGPFEGGAIHILHMLGAFDIPVETNAPPPNPPWDVAAEPLTKDWFSETESHPDSSDYHQRVDWIRKYLEWFKASVKASRAGILANLAHHSGGYHAPIENVDTAGASWSFPQVLAWIATRDRMEVARMQYAHHWDAPLGDDAVWHLHGLNNDRGRKNLIGWLVLRTSVYHCKCGSVLTLEREPWETCQCVGRAYDDLMEFTRSAAQPIPEYQPKPAYASFTLTWPDGAHNLRFARAEVIARWPQQASSSLLRSPAVKEGRPPGDDDILAKADEMKVSGMTGYAIAKAMRHHRGFENVATTEVRELIKGRWKPKGRPAKKAHK